MAPLSRTLFLLLFVSLSTSVPAADSVVPPARTVSHRADAITPPALARVILEQTGTTVDVSALPAEKSIAVAFGKAPFWTAIEQLAEQTGGRIVTTGEKIAIRPGKSHSPSHVSGPFRFTGRELLIRGDLETGMSNYDVTLEVAWEPWLNTYRIDTSPTVTTARDDTGKALTVGPPGPRTFTSESSASLTVRPRGLSRAARSLTLAGSVRMTIADELLTFSFDAVGKPGPAAAQKGVVVTATRIGPEGNDWVAEVQMRYPNTGVTWESHEFYWARHNVLRLLPPGGKPIVADSIDYGDGAVRYMFKNRAGQVGAGWKFDYRTPGPMREISIPFELKNIPLP